MANFMLHIFYHSKKIQKTFEKGNQIHKQDHYLQVHWAPSQLPRFSSWSPCPCMYCFLCLKSFFHLWNSILPVGLARMLLTEAFSKPSSLPCCPVPSIPFPLLTQLQLNKYLCDHIFNSCLLIRL